MLDNVPYERRLAAAVGFTRQQLLQGHWRITRATRMFSVRAEDIEAELKRLGVGPQAKTRTPEKQKPAQINVRAYCPICREERPVKARGDQPYGSCSICGSTVGVTHRH
jgi:hypothetical protein